MNVRSLSVVVICLCLSALARETVVWEGRKTVDCPVRLLATDVVVRPGADILFRGEGRLELRDGTLIATNAHFAAEGVLTNAFRIGTVGGGMVLDRCRFRGLRSVEPVKGRSWFIGSVQNEGAKARIVDCTFEDSSAIAVVNAREGEVARNVFDRCETGLYVFHGTSGRIQGNAFYSCEEGLRANAALETEFADNRFTDCRQALYAVSNRRCRFTGNAVFGGASGVMLWAEGPENLYAANLFEDVRGAAFNAFFPMAAADVFANNLISRCGAGFAFGRQKPGTRIVLRANAIVETATGISLSEGEVFAPDNAIWKARTPVAASGSAKVETPGLVTTDPRFRDAARGDYRLRKDSPLRRPAKDGGDIGLFQ